MLKEMVCLVGALMLAGTASAQSYFEASVAEADGSVMPIEGLQEIVIDDIVWDYKTLESPAQDTRINLGRSARQGYRLYGPGAAHWGSAKFTARGGSKELQAWFQEAAKGKNIRKNITVTLFKSDKSPGRSYSLFDCFPTQWSSVNFDTSSTVQTETLKVNIGRIEFTTSVAPGGGGTGGAGGVGVTMDGVREIYDARQNGEPLLHLSGLVAGSGGTKVSSPGHKSISEITLRGAMTDGRQNLCKWINDSVNGKPWKQMLTITEMLSVDGSVKDGKQYTYHECFPIRYVFPRMSVTNTTGNTMEEVSVKPIRLELK